MKNRIICLLLVLVMMLSSVAVLASCGETGPVDEGDRNEDEFTGDDKNVSKYYEYTWNTTTLKVEISEHSCKGELLPQVKRYLAGGDKQYTEPIDVNIRNRNGQAENVSRTKITYVYLPDIDDYTWGANVTRIAREAKAGSDKSADIYINFIYDMVAASLQGAFANLRSTTMVGSGGKNYFEFMDAFYDPTVDDEGYMYDLMQSLSFSEKKMYVLTSDYLTDVVRAFFVVPVNIKMINGDVDISQVSDHRYQFDKDGNGDFTIDDFFQLVWDNQWNYETIKVLSAAVSRVYGDEPNIETDIFGFACGTESGLHSVGLLYGSDVTIISRQLDVQTGYYNVSYPSTCEALGTLADEINTLFSSTGVTAVSGKTTNATTTSDYKIRQYFAADRIMFGACICAGNLEQTEYQTMKSQSQGFGVAPVPMYREYNAEIDGDKYYRTASHNIAKCAAISMATKKFVQCTAWLDYQSTHSTEILDEYYRTKLQYGVASGNTNNVEVLAMLRNNVSTALDKIYDDAIKNYAGSTIGEDLRWCRLLRRNNFKNTDMRTKYTSAILLKASVLETIQAAFDDLPA